MARDFRGTALRLSTYISVSTVEYVALHQIGVDEEAATWAVLGTMVISMTGRRNLFLEKSLKAFALVWNKLYRFKLFGFTIKKELA